MQVHLDRIVGLREYEATRQRLQGRIQEATALKNTRAMLAIMTAKDNKNGS